MDITDFKPILADFGINGSADVRPLGDGLINHTFLVCVGGTPRYVLQQVNTAIFQDVDTLQGNIDKVTAAIAEAGMTTLHFHKASSTGKTYAVYEGRTWRLMDYISGTSTITEVTPRTAYMTGRAIGEFEAVLAPLAGELGETLPRFHDMEYRLQQFEDAVAADSAGRVAALADRIGFVRRHADFATAPERAHRDGTMPRRVCHCDTKVSNLLFNADGTEVVAVIDLDTVIRSLVSWYMAATLPRPPSRATSQQLHSSTRPSVPCCRGPRGASPTCRPSASSPTISTAMYITASPTPNTTLSVLVIKSASPIA